MLRTATVRTPRKRLVTQIKNRQPLCFEQAAGYIATNIKVKHVLIQLYGLAWTACSRDCVLYVQLKPFWRSQYHPNLRAWFSKNESYRETVIPQTVGSTTRKPLLADAMPYEVNALRCLASSSKMHSHQGAWSPRWMKCVNRHSPFLNHSRF